MRRKILVGMTMAILAIMLMVPVNVMSAKTVVAATNASTTRATTSNGWKKENDRWFYYKNGKVVTGWQTIKSKTYYFKKSGGKGVKGRMLTGWQTIKKRTFYFGNTNDGAMKTGWRKINNRWFYFQTTGVKGIKGQMATGWKKIKGKTYYLSKAGALGTRGRMLSGWNKIKNKYFHFSEANNGELKTGWHTISNNQYYFKISGGHGTLGENLRNGTFTIDGKKYTFNASGVCTNSNATATYPASGYVERRDPTDGKIWKVEPEFDTDPQIGSKNISEEAFFAAVIHTESSDQGYIGQLMVAMCIRNRVVDTKLGYYPNSLKFVVYEDGQYAVARRYGPGRPGPLTKLLKEIQSTGYAKWKAKHPANAESAKAARESKKIIDAWKKDKKKNPRTINKEIKKLIKKANKQYGVKNTTESTSFDYTFFMTPGAFDRLGLSPSKAEKFNYKGHVFFRYWKR